MIKVHDEYGIHDITDYKPSTRCYHPQRFFNKYTGEFVYADCRKCPACRHKYSVELTNRVAQECKQHLFSVFFTLTYANKHLPLFEKVCPTVWRLNRDYKRKRVGDSFIFGNVRGYHRPQKLDKDCFAVCCKEDIQLWLKRLRRKIDYEFKDKLDYDKRKIRYFICSEYGPTTFRPHYHGILWFDSRELADNIKRLILETWPLCDSSRIDVQFVSGSAPQYVAKYVNGFAHLDEVLRTKSSRPFHLASKGPVIGSFACNYKEIYDLLVNRTIERVSLQGGDITSIAYVPVSVSYLRRYFPTCQGFGLSSLEYKYLVFKKYDEGRYKKVYDKEKHKYIECGYRGFAYLDYPDSFKYQDYRFYKAVKEICSAPIVTYKRDKNEKIICEQTLHLSPLECIHLYELLYSACSLYQLNTMYRNMEILSKVDNNPLHLLQFYPNLWCQLPLTCTQEEWNFKTFLDIDSLNVLFSDFGIGYDHVYNNGFISSTFVDAMNNNELDKRFRAEMVRSIAENDRKKKFNELYNNFNKV